jgi:hypothetical protein
LLIDLLGVLCGVYLYRRLKIEPQRHEGAKILKLKERKERNEKKTNK